VLCGGFKAAVTRPLRNWSKRYLKVLAIIQHQSMTSARRILTFCLTPSNTLQ
jgi:hypothetical protein